MMFTRLLKMIAAVAFMICMFAGSGDSDGFHVETNGCRYWPLEPPPSVRSSELCSYYAQQVRACQRSPGTTIINDKKINAEEEYRQKAAELGCPGPPTTPRGTNPERTSPGAGPGLTSDLVVCVALTLVAYFLTRFN
ncbi:hypothetical protein BsWGS_14475 [Bradybaena similaris]